MKKISEHPIAVLIGLTSSVIGIIVFLTGKSDLSQISNLSQMFDSDKKKGSISDTLSDVNNLKISEEEKDKLIRENPFLQNFAEPLITFEEIDSLFYFNPAIPEYFQVKKGKVLIDKDSELIKISYLFGESMSPTFIMARKGETIIEKNEQASYLEGFFNAVIRSDGENDDTNVVELPLEEARFKYIYIGGEAFYFLKRELQYLDSKMHIQQTFYVGFVRNHLITIITQSPNKNFKMEEMNLKLVNSLQFRKFPFE